MENVVIILGPTASGKTGAAVELAREVNGEIISADSMQIYKYMDIGTAKPDRHEMKGIRHYLIDEVEPDREFSVARFKELAEKYIEEIARKGKLPIIAGGTGLYINSLVYNISFSPTTTDWEFRERLNREAEEKGKLRLYERLMEIDPEAASRIHVNDTRRIIRAIEVFEQTGRPMSSHRAESRSAPPGYRYTLFGLRLERDTLYRRINERVDTMLSRGLLEEVRRLKKNGYTKNTTAMQGLGYKEALAYLRGELTYHEMAEYIKRETRRYAKRQMTWFRRNENVFWIDVDALSEAAEIAKIIKDCLARAGIIL